jgi:putative iron-regulated protein
MPTKSLILLGFFFNLSLSAQPIPFERSVKLERAIVENYALLASANYEDSLIGAKILDRNINTFLNTPTQLLMNAAKKTWASQARMPYGQSEIFRFTNGPIDFEAIDDGVTTYLESINFKGVEGLMNAWPLDEAFIDYVQGDATTGIINNPSISINSRIITELNERDGEKNISTGYHAIEFLLWGQDFNKRGPGSRPLSDYTTAKNADRRKSYLKTLSDTLVTHLSSVQNQWKPNKVNYRDELLKKDSRKILAYMFTSMIAMAGDELKSERIENALLLEDQEEEQSCFSDTTINDIYTNFLGVKNVYLGSYKALNDSSLSVKGPGIEALIQTFNPTLNSDITEALAQTEASITEFYNQDQSGAAVIGDIALPFDVAIISQQPKVQLIIDNLDHLDTLLRQASSELGL